MAGLAEPTSVTPLVRWRGKSWQGELRILNKEKCLLPMCFRTEHIVMTMFCYHGLVNGNKICGTTRKEYLEVFIVFMHCLYKMHNINA
jgi:hypothetical protein